MALAILQEEMGVQMVSTVEVTLEEVVDRVRRALSDPQWDLRTIESIVRDTELPSEQVEHVLAENQDVFRQSYLTHEGKPLYTLREKPESLRERYAELRDFIASPVTYRR